MSVVSDFFKNLFSSKPSTTTAPAAAGKSFPGIVAAKVLTAEKHPNADRLRVLKLDIGSSVVEPVVCGATNFDTGDVVALALPGATITHNLHSEAHESFVLEKAKIRGIESQGMVCAASELGVGPGSEKPEIMLLKGDTVLGSTFNTEMVK
jgi:phenylalanyl-tRNA synthetase beta chain